MVNRLEFTRIQGRFVLNHTNSGFGFEFLAMLADLSACEGENSGFCPETHPPNPPPQGRGAFGRPPLARRENAEAKVRGA